ncbi:Tfp pilus assembly protein PilE [Planomicrobium koreense]|uniref:Tfp pilus assembly protein PilE n=1 Tax=Planococcus koreensis TaxID=112331 RepID=A0A7W8CUV3_9BACL|nr:hypothetical protein [Planococcus koreensis]MBB5180677.1 Tfp pilus assembly protein PilE [Planococcus koreensis]
MNKLKEEGGYTLIIALLLIVLFMGMSAVFVQASLSHATQEQTVDQGNLAVSAAEMGVEKYSKEAENAFAKTYAKVNASALLKKKALEAEVKKYPNHANLNAICLKASKPVMQDWIQCNIDKYDEELRTEFFNEMQVQLSLINKDEVAVSDTLSHELASISLLPMTATDKTINLKMDVTGEKSEPNQVPSATKTVLRSKTLPTELNFPEVPFFNDDSVSEVEVKWGQPITEVTNFFPQLVDKPLAACPSAASITADMSPCKFDGVITEAYLKALKDANVDGSFYIKVDEFPQQINNFNAYNIPILADSGSITTQPNINQTDNLTLYYKGLLALQNTNVHTNNNFIVAEIITFQNNQNIYNNTIINIGNTAKSTYTASKVTINDGSKLCVNLDGITPSPADMFTKIDVSETNGSSSSDLAVRGTGKIYLFSKTGPATVLPSNAKVVYFNDPTKFLENCGVAVNYNVEGVEIFGLPLLISDLEWDVNMDVTY